MRGKSEGQIDVDRLKAVMRMVAYAIEEARQLDADLFKYTLEVAHAAGAELVRQVELEKSYSIELDHESSISSHLPPQAPT